MGEWAMKRKGNQTQKGCSNDGRGTTNWQVDYLNVKCIALGGWRSLERSPRTEWDVLERYYVVGAMKEMNGMA